MSSLEAWQDRLARPIAFELELALGNGAGIKADIASAVAKTGAELAGLEMVDIADDGRCVFTLTVLTTGDDQFAEVRDGVGGVDGVEILAERDLAMESHRGGACEIRSRSPIQSNTDLRIVYTPGVARVCKAIQAKPQLARDFTNIANKVAIVTNGTAILGLGDIGPLAGLPVMEGKSAIFWEFVGISAEPILIDTKDPDDFIHITEKLAVGFGAIQVEDVAAPECFKITRELDRRLDIPVMHDDQYGTATIVLAGLYSAMKQTGKKIQDMKTAICGAGAAGTAIADLLLKAGAPDVVLCDSLGAIYRGRTERMNPEKQALAEWTNKDNVDGTLADIMAGAELFIGVSQPNIVNQKMVRSMAKDPIVFPLANPVSEISKEDAMAAGAAVYADGRMMNNALAYPGIFRGALDAQATAITIEMMQAAAKALADIVPAGQLLPEMMDPRTHQAVAEATMDAAGQ